MKKYRFIFIFFILCNLLMHNSISAQEISHNNTLDGIVDLYRLNARRWESSLKYYGERLFWILASIEFCWSLIKLALSSAEIEEWIAEITRQILTIGFFFSALIYSSDWARIIINSFTAASQAASMKAGGSAGLSPSNIFDLGLTLAGKISSVLSIFSPASSLGLIISSLTILFCFALISAQLILTLVESYIVISAGIFLMGFGGSSWTNDYAKRVLTYAISVGAKLFIIQLLIGLGESFILQWVENFDVAGEDQSIFIVVGSSIVLLALTKSIPDLVQGLISGASLGDGSKLVTSAKAVGGRTLGVAATAVRTGIAGFQALQLAREQTSAKGASASGGNPIVGTAKTMGMAGKNLSQAYIKSLGGAFTRGGGINNRASQHLKSSRAALRGEHSPSSGERDGPVAGRVSAGAGAPQSPITNTPGQTNRGHSSPAQGARNARKLSRAQRKRQARRR